MQALVRDAAKMNGSKGHCPWRSSKRQRLLVRVRGGSPGAFSVQALALFDSPDFNPANQEEPAMADVSTFEDVNLPAETVWSVIGDFAGIRKWAVLVQSESVEDTPTGKV